MAEELLFYNHAAAGSSFSIHIFSGCRPYSSRSHGARNPSPSTAGHGDRTQVRRGCRHHPLLPNNRNMSLFSTREGRKRAAEKLNLFGFGSPVAKVHRRPACGVRWGEGAHHHQQVRRYAPALALPPPTLPLRWLLLLQHWSGRRRPNAVWCVCRLKTSSESVS